MAPIAPHFMVSVLLSLIVTYTEQRGESRCAQTNKIFGDNRQFGVSCAVDPQPTFEHFPRSGNLI